MPLSLDTVERAHVLFDAFQDDFASGQISLQHLNSLFHHEAFEASDVRSEYIAILKPACQSGDGATLAVWLSFFEALEDKGTLLTESLFHLKRRRCSPLPLTIGSRRRQLMAVLIIPMPSSGRRSGSTPQRIPTTRLGGTKCNLYKMPAL
jgi:hypothetical protein